MIKRAKIGAARAWPARDNTLYFSKILRGFLLAWEAGIQGRLRVIVKKQA